MNCATYFYNIFKYCVHKINKKDCRKLTNVSRFEDLDSKKQTTSRSVLRAVFFFICVQSLDLFRVVYIPVAMYKIMRSLFDPQSTKPQKAH